MKEWREQIEKENNGNQEEVEPDIVSLELLPISGNGTAVIMFSEALMTPNVLW